MRNANVPHNTEDKGWWTDYGAQLENLFCSEVAPRLSLDAKINPEKSKDRFAPDLVVNGVLADLKSQHTPFFSAGKYGKDAGRVVTFNEKDLLRYLQRYPDLDIYFYVRWDQLSWKNYTVTFLHGVWQTNVDQINGLIKTSKAPRHSYQHRVNDTRGNAKESYVLSLDDLNLVGYLD